MMNILKIQQLFVLVFLFQTLSFGQEWVSYESQNQINDLVDNGTELVMATDAGLVVMNKATLAKTLFDVSNSNLPFNHIQSVTEDANGNIWIGTYDVNIAMFNGADFVDVESPQNPAIPANTELYDIKVAPNGDLWLGIKGGVLQKQGASWIFHGPSVLGANFFEAWDIEIDASGDVYVGANDVHKFSGGVWSVITTGSTLLGYLDADLFIGNDGTIYFGGDLQNIGRYDGTSWTLDNVGFTINNFQSGKFVEDASGDVYFNTIYSGILKFDSMQWNVISDAQTIAYDNRIDYFHIDDQGNNWMNKNIDFTVNRNGAIESTRIADHTLETVSTGQVRKGANGKVYFLTSLNENISVVDENGIWSLIPLPANPGSFVNDVLVLADDNIWLATSLGLFQYDGSVWTPTPLDVCRSFAQDGQGKVYVRSDSKIYILDNGTISEYNSTNSSLTNLNIIGHGVDDDENLWIAAGGFTNDNLIQKRENNGTWTTYTEADHPVIRRPVGDFSFDNDGNMWVADDQGGAIKFDGTIFTNPLEDALGQIANFEVNDIEIDTDGKLFFSHQYGCTTSEDGVFEDLLIPFVPVNNTSSKSNIVFDDAGNLWWANSRYGVYAYEKELTNSILSNSISEIAVQLYPNPTTRFVNLSFEVESNTSLSINVFNTIGQLVKPITFNQQVAGKQELIIDVSNLTSGMYLLQVQLNDKFVSKTLLVR